MFRTRTPRSVIWLLSTLLFLTTMGHSAEGKPSKDQLIHCVDSEYDQQKPIRGESALWSGPPMYSKIIDKDHLYA